MDAAPIPALPLTLWSHVAAHLERPADVAALSEVCRSMRRVAAAPAAWVGAAPAMTSMLDAAVEPPALSLAAIPALRAALPRLHSDPRAYSALTCAARALYDLFSSQPPEDVLLSRAAELLAVLAANAGAGGPMTEHLLNAASRYAEASPDCAARIAACGIGVRAADALKRAATLGSSDLALAPLALLGLLAEAGRRLLTAANTGGPASEIVRAVWDLMLAHPEHDELEIHGEYLLATASREHADYARAVISTGAHVHFARQLRRAEHDRPEVPCQLGRAVDVLAHLARGAPDLSHELIPALLDVGAALARHPECPDLWEASKAFVFSLRARNLPATLDLDPE
jgi:hypothetical protein